MLDDHVTGKPFVDRNEQSSFDELCDEVALAATKKLAATRRPHRLRMPSARLMFFLPTETDQITELVCSVFMRVSAELKIAFSMRTIRWCRRVDTPGAFSEQVSLRIDLSATITPPCMDRTAVEELGIEARP